jgi:hypothetical protein
VPLLNLTVSEVACIEIASDIVPPPSEAPWLTEVTVTPLMLITVSATALEFTKYRVAVNGVVDWSRTLRAKN